MIQQAHLWDERLNNHHKLWQKKTLLFHVISNLSPFFMNSIFFSHLSAISHFIIPQATFAFPWLESAGPSSYQKITIKRSFKTYFVKERKRLACVTTWRTQIFCKNNIWHSVNREKLAPQEKKLDHNQHKSTIIL